MATLGTFKYGFRVEVSTELVQGAGFDLAGYLARQAGTAIGLGLGSHLIHGTGSGQPRGVLLDASTGVTGPAGTGTGFGAQGTAGQGTDLLYDLFGSLAEPYTLSPAAGWLLRNATLTSIRKLKTTTAGEIVGGEFVGDPPAGSGASATMIGKPAFVDPFLPAMANTAKSTAFGDWSRYFVRMVNGIRFERSTTSPSTATWSTSVPCCAPTPRSSTPPAPSRSSSTPHRQRRQRYPPPATQTGGTRERWPPSGPPHTAETDQRRHSSTMDSRE